MQGVNTNKKPKQASDPFTFLKAGGKKFVNFAITNFCNAKCKYCSFHLERNKTYVKYEDACRAIDYLIDINTGVLALTGGEPLCDEQEAAQLCKKIKKLGLLVKVDTNGAFPDSLKKLIEHKLVDYVAMDIKAPLDKRYNTATGKQVDLENIKKSIEILMSSDTDYEFRTTCAPGIIDENAIHQIGKTIKGAKKWALQAHVPDNAYKKLYQQKLGPEYYHQLKNYFNISKQYVTNTLLRAKV